jgi:hypothetical protein
MLTIDQYSGGNCSMDKYSTNNSLGQRIISHKILDQQIMHQEFNLKHGYISTNNGSIDFCK